MKNMIIIDDDKVHYLDNYALDEHAEKLKWLFNKMKGEFCDYLHYKTHFIASMKKDMDKRTMMLDEFKHFKNVHKEFIEKLKHYADTDEEKVILDSMMK